MVVECQMTGRLRHGDLSVMAWSANPIGTASQRGHFREPEPLTAVPAQIHNHRLHRQSIVLRGVRSGQRKSELYAAPQPGAWAITRLVAIAGLHAFQNGENAHRIVVLCEA